MKTFFREFKTVVTIELFPETIAEATQLMRLSNNAKAQKPDIRFYFSNDNPSCTIFMRKKDEKNQTNTLPC